MDAPMIRCPKCRLPAVVITLSDSARATCSTCGNQWIEDGWHPSLDALPPFQPPQSYLPGRPAALHLNRISSFELGLRIVRQLVKERGATVLDYDVTPEGGVVNLRVVLMEEDSALDRS